MQQQSSNRITQIWSRFELFFFLIMLTVLSVGCHTDIGKTVRIQKGSSRIEVQTLLGEPHKTQELVLPIVPFHGPQESLTGIVPAGTLVEEWVYVIDKEELYVWFAGQEDQSKDEWQVVTSARYPVGAVY